MKIYIASSWKNKNQCLFVAYALRNNGHEVDCFCDPTLDRYTFNCRELENVNNLNSITFLENEEAQKAFAEDRKWLDWADAVVMVLPCGRSAHLEAGYVKGQGKKFYIYGEFPKGEFDVMYGFADGMYRYIVDLLSELEDK